MKIEMLVSFLAARHSGHTLSLKYPTRYGSKTLTCLQNSRLYGVRPYPFIFCLFYPTHFIVKKEKKKIKHLSKISPEKKELLAKQRVIGSVFNQNSHI